MKKLWIAAGFAAIVAGITAAVVKIARNHRDRPDDEEILAMPSNEEVEAPVEEPETEQTPGLE